LPDIPGATVPAVQTRVEVVTGELEVVDVVLVLVVVGLVEVLLLVGLRDVDVLLDEVLVLLLVTDVLTVEVCDPPVALNEPTYAL
jgi:hypothetical protein